MKRKFRTSAILSLLLASCVFIAPVRAEGGSARFNFAPNVWGAESVPRHQRRAVDPVHTVRSGSVPSGSSFLGLDRDMLQKPVPPPMPQVQVAATPSFTRVTPQAAIPRGEFSSQFGKPGSLDTPTIAHVPQAPSNLPQMAKAKVLSAKPGAAKKSKWHNSTQDVYGTIAKVAPPKGNSGKAGILAQAGNGVDSYGKNFGYVPGPYLPSPSADGLRTSTTVYGQLIDR